ncbi:MAG: VOC family protein [Microbacteriaceae bacterium]
MTTLVLGTPCADATRAFYTDFGLTEAEPGRFHTAHGGEQLRLETHDVPTILSIGFGVETAADLDDIAARLRSFGAAPERVGDTVSVVEPLSAITFRFEVAPPLAPERAQPIAVADRTTLVARADVRPLRLGHIVLGCPDVSGFASFCVDGFGLHVSDHVGTGIFMRVAHDHHNLCVVKGERTFLHHTAWKVRNVDEVGYGAANMIRADAARHAWGLGRHAASANYFWYLRDPNGSFAEYYYSELDELVNDLHFWDRPVDAPVLPPMAWGPPPPPDFSTPPASRLETALHAAS